MTTALITFFDAWAETNANARGQMIADALTENATYSDPRSGSRLSGHAAISEYVGMFSANAPGWTAEITKSDAVNNYTRAVVKFGGMGPDGTEMAQLGMYFADLDESGRITALAGFVGETPA